MTLHVILLNIYFLNTVKALGRYPISRDKIIINK